MYEKQDPDALRLLIGQYRPLLMKIVISVTGRGPFFDCNKDDFRQEMIYITEKFPFFVLEDKSSIKGFAYAKPFSDVPAYDWSCELTIYIKEDFKRKGLGRKLYLAVEDAVKMMGIKNMYAYIAYTEREDEHLDNSSMRFHEKMGFERVARFSKCGYKFDTWYDVIWMEKIIGEHKEGAAEVPK